MSERAAAALARQLEDWRAALAAGNKRVGWKLGVGDRERIDGQVAVGHLTSATLLEPGGNYLDSGEADLHADAEIALELRADLDPGASPSEAASAIGGHGIALEIVDLARPPNDPESVVAANVFHRAVAFGAFQAAPQDDVEVTLAVNGEPRGSGRPTDDLGDRVAAAARLLDSVGERLRAGDRIITGSVVQVPVAPGDEVLVSAGTFGTVRLSLSPPR